MLKFEPQDRRSLGARTLHARSARPSLRTRYGRELRSHALIVQYRCDNIRRELKVDLPGVAMPRFSGLMLLGAAAAIGLWLAYYLIARDSPESVALDQPPHPSLDQRWNDPETRRGWYEASQGSRLIPFAWLRALEQPGSEALFMEPGHVGKFGYLPRKIAGGTFKGEQLAVGFVIDTQSDKDLPETRTRLRWKSRQNDNEPWVGFNCSACHTSQIVYEGKPFIVDGGPAMADFKTFIDTLNRALHETIDDPEKWARFEKRVLEKSEGAGDRERLRAAFRTRLKWQDLEAHVNETRVGYGFGRVDAFGRIFNKVALLVAPELNSNGNPPDAPVSIPPVWRVPQYHKVQYNGIAPKCEKGGLDFGAIGRNAGEAIGVFGDVNIPAKYPGLAGYPSSIYITNLVRLEQMLPSLRPPKWPDDIFGPIVDPKSEADAGLLKSGRELFRQKCERCHVQIDRTNLGSYKELSQNNVVLIKDNWFEGDSAPDSEPSSFCPAAPDASTGEPPRTDPWMACNAVNHKAFSGSLEGVGKLYLAGEALGKEEPLADLLGAAVFGTIVGKKDQVITEFGRTLLNIQRGPVLEAAEAPDLFPPNKKRAKEKEELLKRCLGGGAALNYTSRPLNGIWASAPYLHNGSVPTLDALLLPPEERPRKFWVGTREFDPVKVGYRTGQDAPGNAFEFIAVDDDGDHVDGNSNGGHYYEDSDLTKEERKALIAYLKTL